MYQISLKSIHWVPNSLMQTDRHESNSCIMQMCLKMDPRKNENTSYELLFLSPIVCETLVTQSFVRVCKLCPSLNKSNQRK